MTLKVVTSTGIFLMFSVVAFFMSQLKESDRLAIRGFAIMELIYVLSVVCIWW